MVLFGLIKCLSVFHQSRGPVSVFLNFAANLSITDCFAFRIQLCLFVLVHVRIKLCIFR